MKKIKLLSSAIALTALPAFILPITSCNNIGDNEKYEVQLIESEGVSLENTQFQLGKTYTTVVSIADTTLKVGSIEIWMDGTPLPSRYYSFDVKSSTLEIRGKFMTAKSVKIKVNLAVMDPVIKMPKTTEPITGETTIDDSGHFSSKVLIKNCEFTNLISTDDRRWLHAEAKVKDPGEQIALSVKINWTTGNKFDLEVSTDNDAYFYGVDERNMIVISFHYHQWDVDLGTEQSEYEISFPTSIYVPMEPDAEVINVTPKVAENDGLYTATVNGFKVINPANKDVSGRQIKTEVIINQSDTTPAIYKHIKVDRVFDDPDQDPFIFGLKFTIVDNQSPEGEDFVDGKLLPATGQYIVSVNIVHSYKDPSKGWEILAQKENIHFSFHILEDKQTPPEVSMEEGTPMPVTYNPATGTTFNYGSNFAYNFYGYGPNAITLNTPSVTFYVPGESWTPSVVWTQHGDNDKKHKYNFEITIPSGKTIENNTIIPFSFTVEATNSKGEIIPIAFSYNAFKVMVS